MGAYVCTLTTTLPYVAGWVVFIPWCNVVFSDVEKGSKDKE
jgi:hypothetical protein